jgi:hypothetical protein
MNRKFSRVLKGLTLAAAVAAPLAAYAESNFLTGAGPLNASAKVDFRITIPKVLFLQVGTGTLYANNTAVDLIDFNVAAADIGSGTSVAATAGSGDVGNGTVSARVRGNGGNVTLNVTTSGDLSNGSSDSIPWGEVTTTAASWVTGTVLQAPTLVAGAGTPITLTAVAKVVNQDARWTYSYDNNSIVPAGTYGGTIVNNGRVTYTASLP